jgi:structure-specific recognition protein 1
MLFVLGLDKPLRQGNTSYEFLVMQIKKSEEQEIKLKIPVEQLGEQYGDKLKDVYQGALYDSVAKIFKAITKTNIIIPGDFKRYFQKPLFKS